MHTCIHYSAFIQPSKTIANGFELMPAGQAYAVAASNNLQLRSNEITNWVKISHMLKVKVQIGSVKGLYSVAH